jgi:hypothetical protein
MGCNQIKIYNDSSAPLIHNMNWMKDIPDDTKLSEMTIPGTHDSMSLFGICCARTQTWTLVEQMKAGLRYFDIRLRRINNTLRAYHGFVDQKETFDSILVYAFDFLEKNPSETIMFEIISEYDAKNCEKSFVELYEEYTQSYKDKIKSYENRDITMGEIRGKLFVVKVFEGSTSRIPNFFIQNAWSVNFRCYMNNKKRKIKENFHRAISIRNNQIFLNYLSASSDYAMMTPYTAAKQCNRVAMRYHGRLGIVLADYPGEDLIKHLIQQNFNRQNIKEEIKSGDKIYVIHNDTHKYLFLDKNGDENNKIYCVKQPEPLTIRHKNTDINRENFKVGDEIILTGKDGFELEFKIGRTFSGNEEVIDDQSIFMIQFNRNGELQFIECKYENKAKKRHYLFNFTKQDGSYSYYFSMEKVREEEEERK